MSAEPQESAEPATEAGGVATTADAGMLLVCLIWGANFSVMKGAFQVMPPFAFTGVRFAISSALLCALLRWRMGAVSFPPGLKSRIIWLGLLGNTGYQLAFTLALEWGTATNTALIISTVPAMVTVLAGVGKIEPVTPKMWLGTALATLGVMLVVAAGGVEFSARTLKGDVCALVATVFWACYTIGLRGIPRTVPPLQTTALTALIGTPGLVLIGLGQIGRLDWGRVPGPAWQALAYSSILSLIVAYFIWNASVAKVGSARTAIYMCLTPLVAAGVAWFTLGERLVPLQGIGAVLIVAGILWSRKQ